VTDAMELELEVMRCLLAARDNGYDFEGEDDETVAVDMGDHDQGIEEFLHWNDNAEFDDRFARLVFAVGRVRRVL